MTTIAQSVRDLIATAPLIHLTSLNRDGSPQVSVVWMAIENDEFVSGHMRLHQKVETSSETRAWSFLASVTARILLGSSSIWSCTARPGSPKARPLLSFSVSRVYT